jgi:MoxR-like ATPase
MVLADEINRATQQDAVGVAGGDAGADRVTVAGETLSSCRRRSSCSRRRIPFEQEGTYPLPEAQLDRFLFLISVDYPSRDEEIEIARTTTGASLPDLNTILDAAAVLRFQDLVRRVPVPRHIYEFAVDLARRTRPREPESPEWLKPLVSWGAGPRAVQYLVLGARARAALTGSYMVRLEDIMSVAQPVLTHRVLTTFNAESEGITSGDIVSRLVDELNAEPGR